MILAQAVFTLFALITVLGALLAVFSSNIFHSALYLILSLFGVAGIYIFLNAEFLAAIQLIVYVGAISIAIIFAIMLTRPGELQNEHIDRNKKLMAALTGISMFIILKMALSKACWHQALGGDFSLKALGQNFLTLNALGFELVSLVILLAIIGALFISNKEAK